MAKIKWFKVTEDVPALFEDSRGRVYSTVIKKGAAVETGRHEKQVLLENGDIVWGLTTIPAAVVKPISG